MFFCGNLVWGLFNMLFVQNSKWQRLYWDCFSVEYIKKNMNAFTEAFSVTSSIFHSYQPLQGIIASSVLLTSTLLHISHICLLYSLKAIFLLWVGWINIAQSRSERFQKLVMEQMQCIFIIFPLGDIYNPNTHITVILPKYY